MLERQSGIGGDHKLRDSESEVTSKFVTKVDRTAKSGRAVEKGGATHVEAEKGRSNMTFSKLTDDRSGVRLHSLGKWKKKTLQTIFAKGFYAGRDRALGPARQREQLRFNSKKEWRKKGAITVRAPSI